MEALATVAQVAERIELDDDQAIECAGAIDDLSEDARYYGNAKWTTAANTPQSVVKLIVRAATRHMKNDDGITMSRAGDETVQWNQDAEQFLTPGTATFTAEEKSRLREYGGNYSQEFWSVNTFAGSRKPRARMRVSDVPAGSGKPFPFPEPW